MYLNDIVKTDEYQGTRASVVPPSAHIDYAMFWAGLTHGTDSVNLGCKDPDVLAHLLREMADKVDAAAAEFRSRVLVDQAAA